MRKERRNMSSRAAIVRRVVDDVVQNPSVTLSVNTLQQAWRVWARGTLGPVQSGINAGGLRRRVCVRSASCPSPS